MNFAVIGTPFRPVLQKDFMTTHHIDKTIATLLAFTLGSVGLHRFYLRGMRDRWGWLHLSTAPVSLAIASAGTGWPILFAISPLILSILGAFLEALVLGLTHDEKWDAQHNPQSGRKSDSGWQLALLLVLTLGVGATTLIAILARTFDLLFTGGAYG
jgi:TM2 domain-containing membrane protein YozV